MPTEQNALEVAKKLLALKVEDQTLAPKWLREFIEEQVWPVARALIAASTPYQPEDPVLKDKIAQARDYAATAGDSSFRGPGTAAFLIEIIDSQASALIEVAAERDAGDITAA